MGSIGEEIDTSELERVVPEEAPAFEPEPITAPVTTPAEPVPA